MLQQPDHDAWMEAWISCALSVRQRQVKEKVHKYVYSRQLAATFSFEIVISTAKFKPFSAQIRGTAPPPNRFLR